jgi:hypothetical protein
MMYFLAEHLGQPLSTILEMTVSEFQHWLTFLRIKQEKQNGSKSSTN